MISIRISNAVGAVRVNPAEGASGSCPCRPLDPGYAWHPTAVSSESKHRN